MIGFAQRGMNRGANHAACRLVDDPIFMVADRLRLYTRGAYPPILKRQRKLRLLVLADRCMAPSFWTTWLGELVEG